MTTRPAVTAQAFQQPSTREAAATKIWNIRAGIALVTGIAVGSLLGAAIAAPLTSGGSPREMLCTSLAVGIANPSVPFAGLRCS